MNSCTFPPLVDARPSQSKVGHRGQDGHRARTQLPVLLGNAAPDTGSRHKGSKVMSKTPKQPQQASAPKGAISMLQEYVQCSQSFHVPANYSVLQWDFDSQMADAATLEFRAIVSFLLEGVPHHVAGAWQPKKKDAQRDAAERALGLFVGRWSEQVLNSEQNCPPLKSLSQPKAFTASEEDALVECCQTLDVLRGTTVPLAWSLPQAASGTCRATVQIMLLNVPHQFAGSPQRSEAEARADAARRVLWYLQCPGFENIYEPDPMAPAITTMKIPRPPAAWAGATAEGALEVAERKTAIMRVQNRLQQTFELRPGLSAWSWDYKMDEKDEEWPARCYATVTIPVIGKKFTGNWHRGQREAQLDTLTQVTEYLDDLDRNRQ